MKKGVKYGLAALGGLAAIGALANPDNYTEIEPQETANSAYVEMVSGDFSGDTYLAEEKNVEIQITPTETQTPSPTPTSTNTPTTTPTSIPTETKKEEYTVYIAATGEKYHKKNCRTLKNGSTAISLSEAKSRGYTQCGICKP